MIADRYWLDISSQFQGLLKEIKSAIGFQTAPKAIELLLLTLLFQEVFPLDQRSLAVLWQP